MNNINNDNKTKVYSKKQLIDIANRYILCKPEITAVVFYYALIPVVAKYSKEIGETPECVLYVRGNTGNCKTMITRVVIDKCENPIPHEFKFYELLEKGAYSIKEIMELHKHTTILIDDVYPQCEQNIQNKARTLLDRVSRYSDYSKYTNGIIVTSDEFPDKMLDKLLDSSKERYLMLEVKDMPENIKADLVDTLKAIPTDFIENLIEQYVAVLGEHSYEEVISTIRNFTESFKEASISYNTRYYMHVKFLLLSEYMYRIYMCDGDETASAYSVFKKLLLETAHYQQEKLFKSKKRKNVDIINVVYTLFSPDDKYLKGIYEKNNYHSERDTYLFYNGKYYIKPENLLIAVNRHLGFTITKKELFKKLDEAGINEKEGGCNTKSSAFGARQLVINYDLLKQHINSSELS